MSIRANTANYDSLLIYVVVSPVDLGDYKGDCYCNL